MLKPKMRSRLCTLALGGLVATGCGESVTGSTGDALTATEVEVLLFPMVLGFGGGFPSVEYAPEFSTTVDQVIPCQSGGYEKRGTLTGAQDAATERVDISVEFVLSYFNCEFLIEGVTLRMNGEPGARVVLEYVQDSAGATYDFRVRGGVDFEASDGRAGRCAIDLTVTLAIVVGATEPSVDIRGSACRFAGAEVPLLV